MQVGAFVVPALAVWIAVDELIAPGHESDWVSNLLIMLGSALMLFAASFAARRRTNAVWLYLVVLLPVAAVCGAVEVMMRRGGTVYVEARHGR